MEIAMSTQEILSAVATGKLKPEDAGKLIAANGPPKGKLSCKVSVKGAISVYGLNSRMPVTLYAGQWERLLEGAPKDHFVLKFIRENEGKQVTGTNKDGQYTTTIARKG
jgi:hypothetical protein